MSTIYVFGHQNPDNDSVSSAVSYAYLKNRIDPDNTYVPARLGAMPKETAWVFGEYGIDTPVALPHVHNRVMDAMTSRSSRSIRRRPCSRPAVSSMTAS